ncbi:hypothetical protein ABIB26_000082 [Arthrobacter sp. UYEF20]
MGWSATLQSTRLETTTSIEASAAGNDSATPFCTVMGTGALIAAASASSRSVGSGSSASTLVTAEV